MDKPGPLSMLLVDDHPLLIEGMKTLLQRDLSLEALRTASDAESALQMVRESPPDIVIIDLNLPHKSGLNLIKELNAEFPKLRLLVLSMHGDRFYAERAMKQGAHGYVWKQQASEELLNAIKTVMSGKVYLSPGIQEQLIQTFQQRDPQKTAIEQLTDREFEIFEKLGQGYNVKEIAADLNIGQKTVETHRLRIRDKLALSSSQDLAFFANSWVRELEN